jgi:hypothetical protein
MSYRNRSYVADLEVRHEHFVWRLVDGQDEFPALLALQRRCFVVKGIE